VLAAVAGACSIKPEWQRVATGAGLNVAWVDTGAFRHLVIANAHPDRHLRIYIEGDGLPWILERRIAIDPTPANPLLLRLMADDTHAAVYLGRPCYFGTATSGSCEPAFWTAERYGSAVVRSMCDAANRLSLERRSRSVALIGYSGGAAIAIAMRSCTLGLNSITTIAGNLDVEAWAKYHKYSPLVPPVPAETASGAAVAETHWQCRGDRKIPPHITDRYFEKRPEARRILVDDCGHDTGWERYRSRIQASADAGRQAAKRF
jgi:pimeloyl-ACP methyl ester carboxylesterase